jgi:hypothetical protein
MGFEHTILVFKLSKTVHANPKDSDQYFSDFWLISLASADKVIGRNVYLENNPTIQDRWGHSRLNTQLSCFL